MELSIGWATSLDAAEPSGSADRSEQPLLLRGGRNQLLQKALGMHLAQRMIADAEPAGVVGNDHCAAP
ncbi:hypothetical protein [Rhizobium sp. RAF56]|uniref:hypothetical protein n=1 Tax=Rhizobium sp. RAF56 TaxID=3233062 RepID=UPI003F9C419C